MSVEMTLGGGDESWFMKLKTESEPKNFTLLDSATKTMLSSVVESSNAFGLFKTSSAPFIDKHFFTCDKHWELQFQEE